MSTRTPQVTFVPYIMQARGERKASAGSQAGRSGEGGRRTPLRTQSQTFREVRAVHKRL